MTLLTDSASLRTTSRYYIQRSYRYKATDRVFILKEAKLMGVGQLLNISQTGVAFQCEAWLDMRSRYILSIERVADLPIQVVRRGEHVTYGARFLITESRQYSLGRFLKERYKEGEA
ncbi:MAG: PilZ domain-containing protein [Pseudomonadota bacterium]